MSKKDNIYSEERKRLQSEGGIPEWMSTGSWQIYSQKYLYNASNVREQYDRISSTLAKHVEGKYPSWWEEEMGKGTTWKDAFHNIIWSGDLSPSTPVHANTGTDRGCTVSCSGGYVPDSIDGFYSSRYETALLTKEGFGTSAYLGDIRGRGSKIRGGGKATGSAPVFKGFVQDSVDVSQGNARRGAWVGSIEIDHKDWDEICDFVEEYPDDVNAGWIVKDNFINALQNKDGDAIRRFGKAMKCKMKTGKGYYTFIDKINRARPQMYKDLGLEVKASNLCVAPETMILTDKGYLRIEDLEGQKVNVWNGEEFTETTVAKTGVNQKLIKVITDSGYELECTPYHKFYVQNLYDGVITEVRAADLSAGDKLIKFDLPILDGTLHLEHAYDNGFFSGDGCFFKGVSIVYLYGEKKSLISRLTAEYSTITEDSSVDRVTLRTTHLRDKFWVPSVEFDIKSRLDWLAGILDADGCVYRNGSNEALAIVSVEKQFLLDIQLMLQSLGISAKVVDHQDAGEYSLPMNNGTDEYGKFHCRQSYRLLINSYDTYKLHRLGLICSRLVLTGTVPKRSASRFVKIVSVEDTGRTDDTYCFKEMKRGMGMFNGILTGQCQEITLFSDADHTFTCVLSSINLARWDVLHKRAIFIATVFLDCVAQEFIERGKTIKGLERAVRFTEKGRALGLGVMGLHTLFQKRRIPFGSFEAHMLNIEIFKRLNEESLEASQWMASAFGEPEWCKGYGVRNTHRLAVAPTKSTSLIMGGVSEGINPDPAMTFTQTTAAGEIDRINPELLLLMKEKGVYSKKHMQEIIDADGSVQKVSWLTEDEKKVFKTAFEIDMRDVLRLARARQKYLDQMQSLNLFFSSEESEEYIAQIHKEAFLDEGILSLYYCYSRRGVQASKDSCEACQ